MSDIYLPSGPYTLKNGIYKEECLEVLMFKDYLFLCQLYKTIVVENRGIQNKSELHMRLEWLLEQGKTRDTQILCEQCEDKNPVKYFLALGNEKAGFILSYLYACCEKEKCKEILLNKPFDRTHLWPADFSVIPELTEKLRINRRMITELFLKIFGFSEIPTKEEAFRFFSVPG